MNDTSIKDPQTETQSEPKNKEDTNEDITKTKDKNEAESLKKVNKKFDKLYTNIHELKIILTQNLYAAEIDDDSVNTNSNEILSELESVNEYYEKLRLQKRKEIEEKYEKIRIEREKEQSEFEQKVLQNSKTLNIDNSHQLQENFLDSGFTNKTHSEQNQEGNKSNDNNNLKLGSLHSFSNILVENSNKKSQSESSSTSRREAMEKPEEEKLKVPSSQNITEAKIIVNDSRPITSKIDIQKEENKIDKKEVNQKQNEVINADESMRNTSSQMKKRTTSGNLGNTGNEQLANLKKSIENEGIKTSGKINRPASKSGKK